MSDQASLCDLVRSAQKRRDRAKALTAVARNLLAERARRQSVESWSWSDLVKAGARILAEIERLDRAALAQGKGGAS